VYLRLEKKYDSIIYEDQKMKKTLCLILALTFVMINSQAFSQDKSSTSVIAETMVDSYQIGIGDVLEITTWKEPDFTREAVLVRTDGKISFPLLNDFPAAGLSPMELKYNIEKGLKDYVSTPVVTVHVREPVSQKFYVLGEVTKTGEYPLVKHLTVLQAFALAGGFTEWASKKEIILLRHEGGKDKIYRINYKDITKGKDFSQNLKLQADDTIIVP
jgi:polysaccharide export outer membrane protein